MKYSILFLNWDPDHKLCEIIKESLHSIISNSIGYDYELIILDRLHLRAEINRGFKVARGEYMIVISNDVIIKNKWLDFMAVPGTITSWRATKSSWIPDQLTDELDCSCFCVPKSVWEKVGDWDENFGDRYGYDDNDYLYRATKLDVPLLEVGVKLEHITSSTFNQYRPDKNSDMGINHDYILRKHGFRK